MRPVRAGTNKRFGILLAGGLFLVASSTLATQSDLDSQETASLPVPTANFVNTADLVVPSAQEVVPDVQSILSASRFQLGRINGHLYVMFPDGSARVYDSTDQRQVISTIKCAQAQACQIQNSDGTQSEVTAQARPRPILTSDVMGESVAVHLAEWILAGTGTPQGDETVPEEEEIKLRLVPPIPPMARQVTPPSEQPLPLETTETARLPAAVRSPIRLAPTMPPSSVSTLPEVAAPEELSLAEQYNLRCSATGSTTLIYENDDGSTQPFGKPRLSLGCSADLTDRLTLRVSMIRYLFPDQQEDFDPDFTYAFNYKVSDKINLGYSNYSAQFDGPEGNFIDGLTGGSLRASYRLPKLELPNEKSIGCTASANLPDPTASSVNLSCGYSITPKLRVSGTAYFYFPDRQGEFDPDFSYTASYRVSDKWQLSYSNYGNNRWPWNPSESPGRGFGGGTISATYTISF